MGRWWGLLGGGSWGDGAGSHSSPQHFFTGDSISVLRDSKEPNTSELLMALVQHHYFMNKNECSDEGLIKVPSSPLQNIIATENADGTLTKITSLEDLLKVFLASKSLSSKAVTNLNPPEDFKSICNPTLMGPNLKIAGYAVDKSEASASIPRGRWDEGTLRTLMDQTTDHHNLPAYYLLMRQKKYLRSDSDNELVYLECSSDGEKLSLKSANEDLSFDLTLKPHKIKGEFSIRDIHSTYDFSATTENFWEYYYSDEKFTILVSLDPGNNPLVSVKILKIPPEEQRFGSVGINNVTPHLKFVEVNWYSLENEKGVEHESVDTHAIKGDPQGHTTSWGAQLTIH